MGEEVWDEVVKLELNFPRLTDTAYGITSEATPDYNCIAWAAGDDSRWWEPDPFFQYYWPERVERQYTVRAYAEAFLGLGFELCTDGAFEEGKEKVAIFAAPDGLPTHAARQLSDGTWTSKLGKSVDIRHVNLEDVGGRIYGDPVLMLQRPTAEPSSSGNYAPS